MDKQKLNKLTPVNPENLVLEFFKGRVQKKGKIVINTLAGCASELIKQHGRSVVGIYSKPDELLKLFRKHPKVFTIVNNEVRPSKCLKNEPQEEVPEEKSVPTGKGKANAPAAKAKANVPVASAPKAKANVPVASAPKAKANVSASSAPKAKANVPAASAPKVKGNDSATTAPKAKGNDSATTAPKAKAKAKQSAPEAEIKESENNVENIILEFFTNYILKWGKLQMSSLVIYSQNLVALNGYESLGDYVKPAKLKEFINSRPQTFSINKNNVTLSEKTEKGASKVVQKPLNKLETVSVKLESKKGDDLDKEKCARLVIHYIKRNVQKKGGRLPRSNLKLVLREIARKEGPKALGEFNTPEKVRKLIRSIPSYSLTIEKGFIVMLNPKVVNNPLIPEDAIVDFFKSRIKKSKDKRIHMNNIVGHATQLSTKYGSESIGDFAKPGTIFKLIYSYVDEFIVENGYARLANENEINRDLVMDQIEFKEPVEELVVNFLIGRIREYGKIPVNYIGPHVEVLARQYYHKQILYYTQPKNAEKLILNNSKRFVIVDNYVELGKDKPKMIKITSNFRFKEHLDPDTNGEASKKMKITSKLHKASTTIEADQIVISKQQNTAGKDNVVLVEVKKEQKPTNGELPVNQTDQASSVPSKRKKKKTKGKENTAVIAQSEAEEESKKIPKIDGIGKIIALEDTRGIIKGKDSNGGTLTLAFKRDCVLEGLRHLELTSWLELNDQVKFRAVYKMNEWRATKIFLQ